MQANMCVNEPNIRQKRAARIGGSGCIPRSTPSTYMCIEDGTRQGLREEGVQRSKERETMVRRKERHRWGCQGGGC